MPALSNKAKHGEDAVFPLADKVKLLFGLCVPVLQFFKVLLNIPAYSVSAYSLNEVVIDLKNKELNHLTNFFLSSESQHI